MNLLIDIGNTHTNLALSSPSRISPAVIFPTKDWHTDGAEFHIQKLIKKTPIQNVFCCSVAPSITQVANKFFAEKVLILFINITENFLSFPGNLALRRC